MPFSSANSASDHSVSASSKPWPTATDQASEQEDALTKDPHPNSSSQLISDTRFGSSSAGLQQIVAILTTWSSIFPSSSPKSNLAHFTSPPPPTFTMKTPKAAAATSGRKDKQPHQRRRWWKTQKRRKPRRRETASKMKHLTQKSACFPARCGLSIFPARTST